MIKGSFFSSTVKHQNAGKSINCSEMEYSVNNLTESQKGKKIMHSFSLIKSINYRRLQGALDIIYSMKRNGLQIRKLISMSSVDLLTTDNSYGMFFRP